MKILFSIVALLLCYAPLKAQNQYQLLDREAEQPVVRAAIHYKGGVTHSDAQGFFSLPLESSDILIVHMVYDSLRININRIPQNRIIKMDYRYLPLSEVVVKSKKLELHDIFQRVNDHFAQNYVRNKKEILYEFTGTLSKDGISYFSARFDQLFKSGRPNLFFTYNQYSELRQKVSCTNYDSALVNKYVLNNFRYWRYGNIFSKSLDKIWNAALGKRFENNANLDIIISQFKKDDNAFWDILILTKTGNSATLRGNYLNNNQDLALYRERMKTKLYSVTNYVINKKDFAVISNKHMGLPVSSDLDGTFHNLKNRNDFNNLMQELESRNAPVMKFFINFEKKKELEDKYALDQILYADGYFGKVPNNNVPEYTWTEIYKFKRAATPADLKKSWNYLIEYDKLFYYDCHKK